MPTLTVTSSACAAAMPPTMARQTSSVCLSMVMIRGLPGVNGRLFGFDEIAAFTVPLQHVLRAQPFEHAHDLASVAAADCRHQLLEGFRPLRQRRIERRKALARKARRR